MSSQFKHIYPTGPRTIWQDVETRVFLKSWKDKMHVLRLIKKRGSKTPLYYAISKDLQKYGHSRTMKEVHYKVANMGRDYRKAKNAVSTKGKTDFRYYKEMDEIVKMEAEILGEPENTTAEPQIVRFTEQPHTDLEGSLEETVASEHASDLQVITINVPENQDASDLNSQLYTVINYAEPEAENEQGSVQVTLPQSSSSDTKKTSGNILLSFYKEFERSNKQLEKNDAAMLELFKEQNDIFRTQTTLLMKLLLK